MSEEFYRDARTVIQIHDEPHHLSILPVPLHDPERSAELKALFPREEGWHHAAFGVVGSVKANGAGRPRAVLERAALARDVLANSGIGS